jgi:hypothetical protein
MEEMRVKEIAAKTRMRTRGAEARETPVSPEEKEPSG